MKITFYDDRTVIGRPDDFSAGKIFDCGQCFRWVRAGDGAWEGSAFGKVLRLRETADSVVFECGEEDFLGLWHDYFDLGRDYAAVRKRLSGNEYMARACGFGAGIRILRQEPWETLCTFIISQCNNIARITGIIGRLCSMFGDEQEGGFHSFPEPERLRDLSECDLAPLRAGYRASYILSAARSVSDGDIDLGALRSCSAEAAEEMLTALPGVGRKVASCVMLFGLGHTEAFPVDTWMRRALAENFEPGFDPRVFGRDAGFAQQYMFYYSRWGGRGGPGEICGCPDPEH